MLAKARTQTTRCWKSLDRLSLSWSFWDQQLTYLLLWQSSATGQPQVLRRFTCIWDVPGYLLSNSWNILNIPNKNSCLFNFPWKKGRHSSIQNILGKKGCFSCLTLSLYLQIRKLNLSPLPRTSTESGKSVRHRPDETPKSSHHVSGGHWEVSSVRSPKCNNCFLVFWQHLLTSSEASE